MDEVVVQSDNLNKSSEGNDKVNYETIISQDDSNDSDNADAYLFTTRWIPSIDGFFEFVQKYRQTIGCSLGGTRVLKHRYSDPTISQVLSVGSEDDRSALPQRVSLSNFRIGPPITSYGCILRYNPTFSSKHENKETQESQRDEETQRDENQKDEESQETQKDEETQETQKDEETQEIEYLLIRRNDSVGYIDFIRGNYGESQLFFMLRELPDEERARILKYRHQFDVLWYDLHHVTPEGSAYKFARKVFDRISPHIPDIFKMIPSEDPKGKHLWLFPKGRPNYSLNSDNSSENLSLTGPKLVPESPFECALREFTEESNGLHLTEDLLLYPDPLVERFLGSNSKNYQTNYFVFETSQKIDIKPFPKVNTGIREVSVGEAGMVRWISQNKLEKNLRPSRLKLIQYIESHLPSEKAGAVSEIWKCPSEISEIYVDADE